jgi:hypothetical protein
MVRFILRGADIGTKHHPILFGCLFQVRHRNCDMVQSANHIHHLSALPAYLARRFFMQAPQRRRRAILGRGLRLIHQTLP